MWAIDTIGVHNSSDPSTTSSYFGQQGDIPVLGDWSGDGRTKIGIFRNGLWALDSNGNFQYDPAVDAQFYFGQSGDTPIVGDWSGIGRARIGIFRAGLWVLDTTGSQSSNNATYYNFGVTGDLPVVGDWNGNLRAKVGIFRSGGWSIDYNGNGQWDAGDISATFGQAGDTPVVGNWNLAPDFVVSTPPEQDLSPGAGSVAFVETVTGMNGFSSPVTFGYSNWPQGLSASISSNPAAVGGSATVNVSAATGAAFGEYALPLSENGGGISHSSTIPLTVTQPFTPSPDYILQYPTLTIRAGTQTTFTLTIKGLNGFNAPVLFQLPSWPAGLSGSISPGQVNVPGSVSVTISTASWATLDNYNLPFSTTGGGISHAWVFQVSVGGPCGVRTQLNELIAFSTGDVYAYLQDWNSSADPGYAQQWVTQIQSASLTLPPPSGRYGPTSGTVAVGNDVSHVRLPLDNTNFNFARNGFGTYRIDQTGVFVNSICGYPNSAPYVSPYPSSKLIPRPSLSNMSNNFGVPGQVINTIITGNGILFAGGDPTNPIGVTGVGVSGGSGVTAPSFTNLFYNPATSNGYVQVGLNISPSAVAGTYNVWLNSFGVATLNTLPFYVLPQVDTVDTSGGIVSSVIPVTFTGSGFGANPSIQFSGSGITAVVDTVNSSNNLIKATLTVDDNAPLGDQTITVVSNGQRSNTKPFTVSLPSLRVLVAGNLIQSNDCAYITSEPLMPQLSAQLTGGPLTSNTTWSLQIQFTRGDGVVDSDSFAPAGPIPGYSAWNITASFGDLFRGGSATLLWKYGSQAQQSFPFCIRGNNPTVDAVRAELDTFPTYGAWFLHQLADQESGYRQFNANLPYFGPPHGYGVMQVDNTPSPTPQDLWNWKQDIADGKEHLRVRRDNSNPADRGAYVFWNQQVDQWTLWNEDPDHTPVPSPDDTVDASCNFTASVGPGTSASPNPHSYADAIWIKQYNGASPNYIAFDDQNGVWNYNGGAFVTAVCSKAP